MTNAEAIEILKHLRDDLHLQSKEYIDCFDMAISALEKQEQKKPLTVGDRIRAMTDEELADWLKYERISVCPPDTGHIHCNISDICADRKCWLDWLKQEAEE